MALVQLTQPEVQRVLGWAHADRHPDETTLALRGKCAAALSPDPAFRRPMK